MSKEPNGDPRRSATMHLACSILLAYLQKNQLSATRVPFALKVIYQTLSELSISPRTTPATAPKPTRPAVPIKKSLTDEYLICLEDGRQLMLLKRHLRSHSGMTPEQYRAKWHLPSTYPMTAPKYAETRSAIAKNAGLGRGSHRKYRRRLASSKAAHSAL